MKAAARLLPVLLLAACASVQELPENGYGLRVVPDLAPAFVDYDPASFAPRGATEVWHMPVAVPAVPGQPDPSNAHAVLEEYPQPPVRDDDAPGLFVLSAADAERLLWLCYSLVNVSFPVEVWRQARVPDSGAASMDVIIEPAV